MINLALIDFYEKLTSLTVNEVMLTYFAIHIILGVIGAIIGEIIKVDTKILKIDHSILKTLVLLYMILPIHRYVLAFFPTKNFLMEILVTGIFLIVIVLIIHLVFVGSKKNKNSKAIIPLLIWILLNFNAKSKLKLEKQRGNSNAFISDDAVNGAKQGHVNNVRNKIFDVLIEILASAFLIYYVIQYDLFVAFAMILVCLYFLKRNIVNLKNKIQGLLTKEMNLVKKP